MNATIDKFETFMVSPAGRWTRALLGLGLIAGGRSLRKPAAKRLGLIGLLPLAAGAFDLCLLGPLLGSSFKGEDMRRGLRQRRLRDLPYPKAVDLEPAFE